jgi:hypothetical protein
MRGTIELETIREIPPASRLGEALGLPHDRISDPVRQLLGAAGDLFVSLAEPRGIFAEVSTEEFTTIYDGEGRNDRPAPLDGIYPRADRLALFAATLGPALSEKIAALFRGNEPALGYLLDAIAGERGDAAAREMAGRVLDRWRSAGRVGPSSHVLPYSPGYCGWHLSGQGKLFEVLEPAAIGIRLRSSSLMEPLKSVSGVLVAGPAAIHRFEDDFDFCFDCATHACRDRMAELPAAAGH